MNSNLSADKKRIIRIKRKTRKVVCLRGFLEASDINHTIYKDR